MLLTIILIIISNFSLVAQEKEQDVILHEINVKDGDTLWNISNYYLKDPKAWPEILKYNKLPSSDPNVVLPGMKLKVPVILVKEHLRPAYLIYVLNDVKYQRKGTVTWQKAFVDLDIYNDDKLRTMSKSKASARFLTGETIHLDENSYVILRPEKKREEVELFSGAVRASKAKILTETTEVNPIVDPKTEKADFKTKLTNDRTTLVEVYEGIVDVTAQGKTVTLTKNFGTEVKYKHPPSTPRPLPPLPEFDLAPSAHPTGIDTDHITCEHLSLTLKLPELKPSDKSDTQAKVISAKIVKYHLQVAEDVSFKNIIIDRVENISGKVNLDLAKLNLADGKYYYRLSYIDEVGFESKFSSPRDFIKDATPPALELIKPKDNEEFTADFIHIEGKTEPNITVKVNDKTILTTEIGTFSTALMAKKGRNTIEVCAIDRGGNTTKLTTTVYKVEQLTYKKFSEEGKKEPFGWFSTPAGVTIGIITFLVITGVFIIIFTR